MIVAPSLLASSTTEHTRRKERCITIPVKARSNSIQTVGSANTANRGIVRRRDVDMILRSAYREPIKALHQLRAKPGLTVVLESNVLNLHIYIGLYISISNPSMIYNAHATYRGA